jgi:hypothetical protein
MDAMYFINVFMAKKGEIENRLRERNSADAAKHAAASQLAGGSGYIFLGAGNTTPRTHFFETTIPLSRRPAHRQ